MITLNSIIKIFTINNFQNNNTYRLARYVATSQYPNYAGHSKWANIRHIKAEKDAEKADLFRKISHQIKLAIQEGGGSPDPELNTQLRYVVDHALRKNMPMSSIQGVIKKATQSKTVLKKYHLNVRYKQKVFMVCVIYTDKFPVLRMELSPILRKAGATMLDNNAIFEEFGIVQAVMPKEKPILNENLEEVATEDAIECGAEDVNVVDATSGKINFICRPESLPVLQGLIQKKGYTIENAEHCFSPRSTVQLPPDELELYEKFISKLQAAGIEEIYDNVE